MTGCGVLTKGSDSKDDLLPCGTKLWWGKDAKNRTEGILLCARCSEREMGK
jgi:hypothetical protein